MDKDLVASIHRFIEVNERWALDVQHLSNRHHAVTMLFFDALECIEPVKQQALLLRFRGIDTMLRSMYHGNKVAQPDNEQPLDNPEQSSANSESSPVGLRGGPMGEEE